MSNENKKDPNEIAVVESANQPHKNDARPDRIAPHSGASLKMIDVDDLVTRQNSIVKAMDKTMRVGTHYGVPYKGSDKNVLLKAGAEVLGVLFQLSPSYQITRTDLNNGHREVEVVCELHYIPTGTFIGQGVGSCSTKERKYRYRYLNKATGIEAPYEANKIKKEKGFGAYTKYLRQLLEDAGQPAPAGVEVGVTKTDAGAWEVAIKGQGENEDIADEYNTVLKMAKKRAHIDAVLTATGASELFTQDVDEFEDYDPKDGKRAPATDDNRSPQQPRSNQHQSGANSPRKPRSTPKQSTNTNPPPRPAQQQRQQVQAPIVSNYEPEDDTPLHLMSMQNGAKAWALSGEFEPAREGKVRNALSDPHISQKVVNQYCLIAELYVGSKNYIDLIAESGDADDAKGWREALSAAESPSDLKTIYFGIKQHVEDS